ncbi:MULTISPECIES: hypothetical protein [Nocardiopsidaceae]|uniref:Uncharacterized protein n=2 Tax=Nocardiopsidaceae TaxID=83676 RepID=A0ABY6YPL3_9ACTN|nr:hypothetical protein [Streptomonospora nanhaiensis]WAE74303.1 hypothetical protein OUQ99_04055 [Streptomonospora nanhaiensis]
MTEFMLGVTSSLAATAVTVGLGGLLSRRLRWWLLAAVARLSGLGVLRVHRHQDDARAELSGEISRARWLRVMVGRGNELTRDGFAPLWNGGGRPPDFVRVLLPDPGSDRSSPTASPEAEGEGPAGLPAGSRAGSAPGRAPGGGGSWLERREEELISLDPGFGRGLLTEQVLANFHYLSEATRDRKNTEIRFYDLPNLYRVIATDNLVFLTLYQGDAHGRHSPCVVAHRSGALYDFALRIFDTAWESARVPGGAPATTPDL